MGRKTGKIFNKRRFSSIFHLYIQTTSRQLDETKKYVLKKIVKMYHEYLLLSVADFSI